MRIFSGMVALAALVASASGCGAYQDLRTSDFAKQDAAQIVIAAEKSMQDVDRLRITGQRWATGSPIFVDVRVSRRGDCEGSLRLRGRHLDIRRLGDRTWVKGDSGFFRMVAGGASASPEALEQLSRTWVAFSDDAVKQMCDLDALLEDFRVVDQGTRSRSKGGGGGGKDSAAELDIDEVSVGDETSLGGIAVVRLSASPGGAHDEHVWVASEAPHHIVKLESTSTEDGGSYAFSEYDEPFEVVAPRPRDVYRE